MSHRLGVDARICVHDAQALSATFILPLPRFLDFFFLAYPKYCLACGLMSTGDSRAMTDTASWTGRVHVVPCCILYRKSTASSQNWRITSWGSSVCCPGGSALLEAWRVRASASPSTRGAKPAPYWRASVSELDVAMASAPRRTKRDCNLSTCRCCILSVF